jgi:hypothetical protein
MVPGEEEKQVLRRGVRMKTSIRIASKRKTKLNVSGFTHVPILRIPPPIIDLADTTAPTAWNSGTTIYS